MVQNDPDYFFSIAQKHLKKVRAAWSEPDWSDLGTYGPYCIEALIRAAVLKNRDEPAKTHWAKVDQANKLHSVLGLPKIDELLRNLNQIRKAEAYGDSNFDRSKFDARSLATDIETYYSAVSEYLAAID